MTILRGGILVLLSIVSWTSLAQSRFVLGTHYMEVSPPQPTSRTDRIEVVDLFWYGCSHCANFEPYLERWLESKADDIEFVRLPAVFSSNQEAHARAFFTAEKLSVAGDMHPRIFRAIHGDNQPLNTEGALARFFANNGVDEEAFRKVFLSFDIDSKLNRARQLSRRYNVSGTPAIVVNGKYWTSGSLAGSYIDMLKLVDELVANERGRGHTPAINH
ncbi:MAG: thiol:disulfide interchange protein DsbA/DsbL [Gammaproteobacteria bacterium]|nr:thiol:disulfide interchange protein DsbA/DsbL [Gammaproteobacteria bacterium]